MVLGTGDVDLDVVVVDDIVVVGSVGMVVVVVAVDVEEVGKFVAADIVADFGVHLS